MYIPRFYSSYIAFISVWPILHFVIRRILGLWQAVLMVYIRSWTEYQERAEKLFEEYPTKVCLELLLLKNDGRALNYI